MKKALLIRIDRLGDLILTLPADEQSALKDYQCHWFISKGLGFIPDHAQPQRKYTEWQKEFSWSQLFSFIQKIKTLKPDVAISFHSPWWVHLGLFLARVPQRIGVLSKWHSFLFLNRGVRQKRSQCEFHEMEYNHRLVHQGLQSTNAITYPSLRLQAPQSKHLELPNKFIVIHPGMAGSALNWPLEKYVSLIKNIPTEITVVVTGTKTDQEILNPLKEKLQSQKNILWMDGKLNGQELMTLLSRAQSVLVPSTGVIHIAASLGVPTFGIYSPVTVQKADRWGPKGPRTKVFAPNVDCPGHFKCLGNQCKSFNCMELVSLEEIHNNILQV